MGLTRVPSRHPQEALTPELVSSLMDSGRIADGGGLYLHIRPSGSKAWILRTTIHGTVRDLGLGSAALVSLEEAREEAARLRKMARAGGDPRMDDRRRVASRRPGETPSVPAGASGSQSY